MDEAFNQHASHVRRKNRSTTNLNPLTLAPLTSKLPLDPTLDAEFALQELQTATHLASASASASYLQGRSVPTTPALLSRAPPCRPRSHVRLSTSHFLAKSKSATDLTTTDSDPAASRPKIRQAKSGYTTPSFRRRTEPLAALGDGAGGDRGDSNSDWLLRVGALISTKARESKGQAWLVSRESSTSLAVLRDPDDEVLEMDLEREILVASRLASRSGSLEAREEDGSQSGSRLASRQTSRQTSRLGSRSQSRVDIKAPFVLTPAELRMDDYFGRGGGSQAADEGIAPGPDFVGLDEDFETTGHGDDTLLEDEVAIRRLVKQGNSGVGAWMDSMLGWSLFSVSENDEATDGEGYDEDEEDGEDGTGEDTASSEGRQTTKRSMRHFEGVSNLIEERMPAPRADEGGWNDAAWLLSVASRVLL